MVLHEIAMSSSVMRRKTRPGLTLQEKYLLHFLPSNVHLLKKGA